MLSRFIFDLLSAIALAFTAAVGAYLPVVLSQKDQQRGGSGRSYSFILGNMLSAGVMVSAGFCHLLGDAIAQMPHFHQFPMATFLCGCGFLLTLCADSAATMLSSSGQHATEGELGMLEMAISSPHHGDGTMRGGQCRFVEEVSATYLDDNLVEEGLYGKQKSRDEIQLRADEEKLGNETTLVRRDEDDDDLGESLTESSPLLSAKPSIEGGRNIKTGVRDLVENKESHFRDDFVHNTHVSCAERRNVAISAGNSRSSSASGTYAVSNRAPIALHNQVQEHQTFSRSAAHVNHSCHQIPHAVKSGGTLPGVPSVSFVTAVLMGVALCFHSLLEGAAMGAQDTIANSLHIFIAIVSHKGLAAYALGSSIVDSRVG